MLALALMQKITSDQACGTGDRTSLSNVGSSQPPVLPSMIYGNGRNALDPPRRRPRSNRHRGRCIDGAPPSATSCIAGLPTPADAGCGCVRHGRHPQTFTVPARQTMTWTCPIYPRQLTNSSSAAKRRSVPQREHERCELRPGQVISSLPMALQGPVGSRETARRWDSRCGP
jgi:hypothetical protein